MRFFFHRFPKQLLQANDCSVAGKLQPLSRKDIPATLMRKIEAIIGDDCTHYSFSKAYRVVRQSEFYYSMEYTKCRKRNGYTVSYQKLNGHKDCFGHIQFFVLVQPSMCVLAIIQPLVIDLVCEKFCHLIPVKAVKGTWLQYCDVFSWQYLPGILFIKLIYYRLGEWNQVQELGWTQACKHTIFRAYETFPFH